MIVPFIYLQKEIPKGAIMKIKNLICASFGFICVCGGMSLLFIGRANITTVALIFPIFALMAVLAFYGYKNLRKTKFLKIIICVWSVISCSVSTILASKLVTYTGVLDNSHFVLLIFLTIALAVSVSVSKKDAVKSVALIISSFATIVFLTIIALSLIDTSFSMPVIVKPEFEMLLPLAYLSVADVIFIIPFCDSKTPVSVIAGGGISVLFFLVIITIALSVLTNDVYYAVEMPLVKLWQSTFIPSFVNRFEIVSLTNLYLLTAFKCGVILYSSVKICKRKYSLMLSLAVLLISVIVSFL